ncbi:ABC transporter permease [Pedobacter sp. BAL39]|uniref:efflux RND transporter periplasmic adaptor subunit n=1 Tax=Pedobacter sp. BAL39 TaxID=391596 RepID=UPI00015599A1|nr:HlyD family efflux transporter periplasmic adaptor subunit [Pedobacter sp. BAL39]EDM38307.1 ABC transporter permease [Pedobacter sp. BAL39]
MDRQIAEEVSTKKKKKTLIIILIVVTVLTLSLLAMRYYIKPSLRSSEFSTSIVEVGDVANTINATGEVLPEFEEILTSPIQGALRNVLMDAGAQVKAGQSVLTLDKSAAQTEYEKLRFLIESKQNEINKLRLDLDKSFYDIRSNNKIKQLRISNFKDAVASAERLLKAGGGTREDVEQAELNLSVAELEKQQLENEIRNKQQTMKIEIREAELSLAIQKNDGQALKRKLALAEIIATRPGVITWVNKNIGASISEGESLVRIANLSSYKIAGSISDNLMDRLHTGMPAIVRINDVQLRGQVMSISPSVSNAIGSFDVQLTEKNNKLLRPNMKVDVFLITNAHSKVLRITNGPAFKGSDLQDVFVMQQGKALRRTVKTGLSNFDFVEILSGLKAGDRIITSDMSKYEFSNEISITNE